MPAFHVEESFLIKPRAPKSVFAHNSYGYSGIPPGHIGIDSCANGVVVKNKEAITNLTHVRQLLGTTYQDATVPASGPIGFEYLGFRINSSSPPFIVKSEMGPCKWVPDATVNLCGVSLLRRNGYTICIHENPSPN